VSRARLLAAALLAVACAPVHPNVPGPAPPRLRGLDFSVELDVERSGPARLAGSVRVVNRGAEPETLVFADGCLVRLRVYETQGSRVAPVWDGPVECPRTPVALAIAPGESADLPIPETSTREILGGERPGGRYRVTVWLAPDDRIIEIEAGDVELSASR
jgi:hypothetical protein